MTDLNDQRIAELNLILVSKNKRTPVRVGIGEPYQEGEMFRCNVFLDGVLQPIAVAGADSLQALAFAMKVLRVYLTSWTETWKVLYDCGNPECNEDEHIFEAGLYFSEKP